MAGGGALLAVALSLVVVAAEVPQAQPALAGLETMEPFAAARAIAYERAWFERAAALSWGDVPFDAHDPLVRARAAAQSLQERITQRYPSAHGPVELRLANLSISTPDIPSEILPPEIGVRVSGTLEAALPGGVSLSEALVAECADPAQPRARRYLDERLAEQSRDPRSETAAAIWSALAPIAAAGVDLQESALDGVIKAALERAARSLEEELGQPGDTSAASRDLQTPEASAPAPSEPASTAVLEWVPGPLFVSFLRWFLAQAESSPGARALLDAVPILNDTLLPTARALLSGDEGPLRAVLSRLSSGRAAVAGAIGVLRSASLALIERMGDAARGASVALSRLAPLPRQVGPMGSAAEVVLLAKDASARATLSSPAAFSAEGGLVPPIAHLHVAFTLDSSARVREGARWTEATRSDPFTLEIPIPRLFEAAPAAGGHALAVALPPARAAALVGPLFSSFSTLDAVRQEVDRRLTTFRDAVSQRIAQGSASGIARLAFRVLDGFESNDRALSARALFEIMERYFQEDLRSALTVNFTLYGVNFTLVPDPVGQQVSIEHTEGPHTFGARVRRVTVLGDPSSPKFKDHLSLALELYWRYEAPPVSALLTLDPFLRTDEGLVRFVLRVTEGDGFQISVVAPRVIRRAGDWQVALSDFIPGGVPIAATPSGGLVSLDAGARIEFARVTMPTIVRFVLRAVERALFDVLENQSIGEVGEQFHVERLARSFLSRLVSRIADSFASEASRFVIRAEAYVRVVWREAAGTVSGALELGLAVEEPLLVLRAAAAAGAAAGAATLVASALEAAAQPGAVRPSVIDYLPSAIHERIGPTAKVSLHGGLDGLPLLGRALSFLPHAELFQSVFLSLGALASAEGKRAIHWVTEYAVGFEGFVIPSRTLLPLLIERGDTLEAAHLQVESLAGPRLLISEVLPSPLGNDSDLEFIELYNPLPVQEDLTGWSLQDSAGRRFYLPDGTRIGALQTIVVSRSAGAFFRRFAVVGEVPTLTLALNDGGDRLQLVNPRGWVSDEVAWGSFAPGSPALSPDRSLARPRILGSQAELPSSALLFTGFGSDFVASAPTPGRPG